MPEKSGRVAQVAHQSIIGVTRARTRRRTVITDQCATCATHEFPSIVEAWMADRCRRETETFTPTTLLFDDWRTWACNRGIRVGSVKRLSSAIASLGFGQFKTSRQRGNFGLSLNPNDEGIILSAQEGTANRDGSVDQPPVLALDLGTTTGWATRAAGLITSGTVSLRPGRFDGGGMRYLRFSNWLTEIDRLSGPVSCIWFEEVRRHLGTDAAHLYGGFLATLTAWCERKGIPYQGVPVGAIKRFATGKGNADKQAVIAAVRERGFSPVDDNEADAIALLLWAMETAGGVR